MQLHFGQGGATVAGTGFVNRFTNPHRAHRQRNERTSSNDLSRPIAYSTLARSLERLANRLQRLFVVHTSGSSS